MVETLEVLGHCPFLKQLCSHFGTERTFHYVEDILRSHATTARFLTESSVGRCGGRCGAAAMKRRYRIVEEKLYARLVTLNEEHSFGLEIVDTASLRKSGDIICTNANGMKSVWDSKDYKRKVPWSEVKKLARDVRLNGGCFGVIVAANGVSKIEHCGLCDGVPIHVCVPGTVREYTQLYLTRIATEEERAIVGLAAQRAHMVSLIESIKSLMLRFTSAVRLYDHV